MSAPHDVARTRLDNAHLLFQEFVKLSAAKPDVATLRGLERRFAERLEIQPSYWSQIKSRSRQIGERLARQFEQRCRKPTGWMDLPHTSAAAGLPPSRPSSGSGFPPHQAEDDDERFILGLVLTYYRRHPLRARARLLDLLSEVLTPESLGHLPAATLTGAPTVKRALLKDDLSLWDRSAAGVAPLKQKR